MASDSATAAHGVLENKIEQAERRRQCRRSPARDPPARGYPSLWGHIGNLSQGISVAADVTPVLLGLVAIIAFLGNVVCSIRRAAN